MSKEIYISSTPHETRLAIVENDELAEIYYERENEYTLAGSIYNGKVTRVLPGMQSSFVDIGLERDAFLYITDFMEEAGDSADFEANANGADRAPRGDRNGSDRGGSDRGSDRGGRDRGPRPERSEQARLPERSAEPTDADLFTEAVSGLDPNRPVAPRNGSGSGAESERGDRGSRRGGRNRRDRGAFNSDGTPRRDRGESGNRIESSNQADRPAQSVAAPVTSIDAPVDVVPAAGTDEVGEGSPGADGSRRWRGRRGRRGNRAPGREGQPVEKAAAPLNDEFVAAPVHDEPFKPGFEPGYDMGASAEAPVVETPQTPDRGLREGFRNDRGDRGGRDSRGSRDRGGNRGRGGRDGQQAPRVPRGFAPSLSLYKVEGAADEAPVYQDEPAPYGYEAEVAAPSEPVILPGESLSKYRPGGNVEAEKPAVQAAPVVSEFALPGAWDGGLVLPGETIRPRGPVADTGGSGRSESRGRDDRGGRDSRGGDRGRNDRGGRGGRDDRGGRHDRGDRGPRPEFSGPHEPRQERPFDATPVFRAEPVAEAAPVVEPVEHFIEAEQAPFESGQGHVVPIEIPAPVQAPRSEASHSVAPIHSTFVPPPPMPGTEPALEVPHEAPTTFAADHGAAHVVNVEETQEPEFVEQVHEFEPTEASASFRVDPVPPSEYRQAAPVIDEPEVEAAVVEHDVTSISATGEMHSEPVHDMTAVHEEAVSDAAEENAPLLHEETAFEAAEPVQADQPAGHFQPGQGHLEEEEMFEEDEEIVPAIQAHSSEVYDQAEQETLEGAADLGTMLREMSIDQITRIEPSEEEEDDFEEDFLEEDQDFESASEGGFEEDESTEEGLADENLDEIERSEYGKGFEGAHENEPGEAGAPVRTEANVSREPRRDRDGRDQDRGRRDGRRGDRNRRDRGSERSGERGSFSSPGAGSDRERSSSDRGSRDSRGGRNSRQSMQSTNLPAISDLLKPGQEILCQIAKEPIAKKGARITSHIALPGRFLVFMPTVNHTGVSRKIESDSERRRLKEILLSEKGEASGGFIVRTAASGASEEELRSDLRFLLNLWADIKARSESSKSPALIYHDLNLVERVLRDQVTDTFSAIWVDTETEYERVLRFLQRFQPSLIRRVKLYTKETPLFEQFGITEEINKALRSKVWLKSGGSIVINQTEALVAIDINTGKFVGKTARLEDTIVKTNLDAIPEIVRQIRLRDLGGIIIIDFIDMDERKNRNKVMAALEEELKSDRAPSKVLQFNDFGLVAITRKRVKQSLERTLSTTCGICAGTGMVKSAVTVCNDIYVEMRKMHKHLDRGDVMLRVNPEVVKQLKAPGTKWLQEMEEMCGKTILVKSDPSLHPEQFDIH